jgi:GMP synthase-like glutamine amidotransferase
VGARRLCVEAVVAPGLLADPCARALPTLLPRPPPPSNTQLLAEALGGRVGPNPSGRFVLGVETVTPTPDGLGRLPALAAAVGAALERQVSDDAAAGAGKAVAAAAAPQQQPLAEGGGSGLAAEASARLAAAACRPCFRVMESHGDQVLELPPGAVRLASSGTAANELWALGDNVLAFQFHSARGPRGPGGTWTGCAAAVAGARGVLVGVREW